MPFLVFLKGTIQMMDELLLQQRIFPSYIIGLMSNQSITYPRRVALVHDWLITWGGAEKVLAHLLALFPDAPVFTLLYEPSQLPAVIQQRQIMPSFLQKWPGALTYHRRYLPLMPLAVEQWDLSDYDLVISSSHACAKGIITGPDTCHISYIHTPMRYAWDWPLYAAANPIANWKQGLVQPLLHYLRMWDQSSSIRIDSLSCNSHFIRRRIAKYYGRHAAVIYPPVDLPTAPVPRQPADFFLIFSRLVPYKRIDLAIAAFNQLGWPLVIVGEGPERSRLERLAKTNVRFLGYQSDQQRQILFSQARALIFPGIEDFGIVPVEAIAAGCPVMACGRGGATETVVPGQSGWHFWPQTPDALVTALKAVPNFELPVEPMLKQAQDFSAEVFCSRFQDLVQQEWARFSGRHISSHHAFTKQ